VKYCRRVRALTRHGEFGQSAISWQFDHFSPVREAWIRAKYIGRNFVDLQYSSNSSPRSSVIANNDESSTPVPAIRRSPGVCRERTPNAATDNGGAQPLGERKSADDLPAEQKRAPPPRPPPPQATSNGATSSVAVADMLSTKRKSVGRLKSWVSESCLADERAVGNDGATLTTTHNSLSPHSSVKLFGSDTLLSGGSILSEDEQNVCQARYSTR
jgi:hypothetical protein